MRLRVRIVLAVAALLLAVVSSPLPGAAAPRTRAGGLSGTVHGHTGSPVAGATVVAYAIPGASAVCSDSVNELRPVAAVVTRADGTFKLPVGTGAYRVGVTPPDLALDSFGFWVAPTSGAVPNVTSWVGFAHDLFVPTNGLTGMTVRLDEPRAVSGVITEHVSGTPIAGALVRLVPDAVGQLARNAVTVSTAADGSYVFAGLPLNAPDPEPTTPNNEARELGFMVVDPTGWHDLWLWWWSDFDELGNDTPVIVVGGDTETYTRSAVLRASGRIAGKVVNDRGRAVAGIEVAPTTAFPYPPVVTDARGRFYLPAWPEPTDPADAPNTVGFRDPYGRYRTTYYPGVPYAEQGEPLFAEEDAEVTMTMTLLPDAARVIGTVWWTVGVPARGIEVAAVEPTTGYTSGSSLERPLSACDGTFAVTGLWPASYRLDVTYFAPPEHDGYVWAHEYVTLAAGETQNVGAVMLPSNIVDGRLTDLGGNGIPGATAELWLAFDFGGSWALYPLSGLDGASQVTGSNGEFRFFAPPIYSNTYVVRFVDDLGRYVGEWYSDVPLDADQAVIASTTFKVGDDNPYDSTGFTLGFGGSPWPNLAPVPTP